MTVELLKNYDKPETTDRDKQLVQMKIEMIENKII